ncbi:peptidase M20 [Oceanithermus desulfurans NBRC 100063]|uniref:Peptidase M20 n=2 Tax=Oceanithermus desulfurans TaxID=227924 RepID=A0A511RJX9_9DEIN|nr:peptidase M20 [Oceanithermus desulfurans NBRC 100063]
MMSAQARAQDTLAYFERRLDAYLTDLRELVEIESPTHHLPGIKKAALWLQTQFAGLGELRRFETEAGAVLRLFRRGSGPRVLLLAHYDTVHPVGSWKKLWREERGRIYGPGVYDMKAGLLFILWALRYLGDSGAEHPNLEVLLTPDEEVGSVTSRIFIEDAARGADYALVLEPPTGAGDLKVHRKGVGWYKLKVHGRAAHQGVEPEKGVNAIVEAARQLLRVVEAQDLEKGTTLGPNVARGGTASNVVADYAEVLVDLRAWTLEEAERVDRFMRALEPVHPEARLELEGGLNRPPMEPTPESLALFELARGVARDLGFDSKPGKVGGGSDGNFTANLGVPTLDGLGAMGADAHQLSEHVVTAELPRRMALLAELLTRLVRDA